MILPRLSLLFLTLSVSDAFTYHYVVTRHHGDNVSTEEMGYVSCKCYGIPLTARIDINEMDIVLWSIQYNSFCHPDIPERVCLMLKKCDDCSAGVLKCTSNKTSGKDCLESKIELFSSRQNSYEGDHDEWQDNKVSYGPFSLLKRKARQAAVCRYPSGMENADMILTLRPSSITITQKCIFGFTLEEGISREMRCNYEENQWKPKRFEECRPFIDCTVDLVSTGFASCLTATIQEAPTCRISCERYEDKPAVPEETYTCKIDGTWDPHLPHCARPGSGIHLMRAPRVRVHPTETVEVNQDGKKTRKRKETVGRFKFQQQGRVKNSSD